MLVTPRRATNLCKFHFLVIHSHRLVGIDGVKLETERVKNATRKKRM